MTESISQKILNYMTLKLEITSTYFSYNKICQRCALYAGIKIYNNLSIQIKLLSSNFNQFKKALKEFL